MEIIISIESNSLTYLIDFNTRVNRSNHNYQTCDFKEINLFKHQNSILIRKYNCNYINRVHRSYNRALSAKSKLLHKSNTPDLMNNTMTLN